MKKILIGLLIAALCLAGFAVAEGAGDAYLGEWVSGRATMKIVADGDGYDVSIRWGSSYCEDAVWVYEGCLYDDVSGGLSSFEVGVKTDVTYGENGEVISSKELYNDGAAAFVINEESKLVWTDFKETPGENEVTFERMERVEVAAMDYGTSDIYTQDDMDQAVDRIYGEFNTWTGCEMHSIRYGGDEANNAENIAWLNDLREGKNYTECIEFLTDFHSPVEDRGAWEADTEYEDWQWWLARADGGEWELISWGY